MHLRDDESNLVIVGIVHRLAVPAVVPCHEEGPALLEHPEAEHCLEGVVHNHQLPYLIRFSVLHEFWTSNLRNVLFASLCLDKCIICLSF